MLYGADRLSSRRLPNSPKFKLCATDTLTRKFEGPYDVVMTSIPARGTEMSGYAGYGVTDVEIEKMPGNKASMTVTADQDNSLNVGNPTYPEVKQEINWVEIERELRMHPIFQKDGEYELTADDWAEIQRWEDAPADVKADYQYYVGLDQDASPVDLSDNAKKYAEKILRGEETYVDYVPEISLITTTTQTPASSQAGLIGAPSGFADNLPEGYDWLKVADDNSRSGIRGRWEKHEKWQGCPKNDQGGQGWDPDIYMGVT